MKKQRIYIDTSVIGGCEDEEFSEWSGKLFNEFRQDLKIAVVSDITRYEIAGAPERVKSVLLTLSDYSIENVFLTDEADILAWNYIDYNVIVSKHIVDAQHIAIATIEQVDVLASWNFHHIVNLDRIRGFNAVNLKLGYFPLEIRSPREIINEKEV